MGGGFEAADGICEAFGVGSVFSEARDSVVGGEVVFSGSGENLVGGAGELLVVDGLEIFAASGDASTVFLGSSRTCSNTLDVSGVTGVFGEGFEGIDFDSIFEGAGGLRVEGFDDAFANDAAGGAAFGTVAAIGVLFAAVGAAFTAFVAAFVDFALVVDIFFSSDSISIGSEINFLGLPLFLIASVDMLCSELVPESP